MKCLKCNTYLECIIGSFYLCPNKCVEESDTYSTISDTITVYSVIYSHGVKDMLATLRVPNNSRGCWVFLAKPDSFERCYGFEVAKREINTEDAYSKYPSNVVINAGAEILSVKPPSMD